MTSISQIKLGDEDTSAAFDTIQTNKQHDLVFDVIRILTNS
jgi:hypothetical protein